MAHGGSIYWNEHRKRWVMIAVEIMGTSFLGEVWYAEADTPLGPWVYARKVATHEKYDFYNPKQHPFFSKENGRVIYFEGTYTKTFSGNPEATPRYDYNQVMYKLDLDDPRLNLPVMVFREKGVPDGYQYVTARQTRHSKRGGHPHFFALERAGDGTVPFHFASRLHGERLVAGDPPKDPDWSVRIHAYPADMKDPPAGTALLWEFHGPSSSPVYSTEETMPGLERSERPACRVWRSPMRIGVPIDRAERGSRE
jgi:hypothetical protein